MTKTTSSPQRRKRSWFAPRQVYLRTEQGSSYVELSRLLQVSVAIGFGLLALWLFGSSYSFIAGRSDETLSTTLRLKLDSAEQELSEEAAKIAPLEAALADAKAALIEAQQNKETAALSAELQQTRDQMEDVRQQLSESKAIEATLQAKLEAQTAADEDVDDTPAEEASSLHSQLEDAFAEIEELQKARDDAEAKVASITAEKEAIDANVDRNDALLKAATQEIERLQLIITEDENTRADREAVSREEAMRLSALLTDEQAAKKDLQDTISRLEEELQRRDETYAEAEKNLSLTASEAERREADLSATIDELRSQIDAQPIEDDSERDQVKAELALANKEVETLLKNMLSQQNGDAVPVQTSSAAGQIASDSAGEVGALKAELSSARSDIIKLKSDVRAAKQRLSQQANSQSKTTTSGELDRSAKLEQQLASTRSRIQQLNKALADAKLREVAIDLALINVVPLPSPPAPR